MTVALSCAALPAVFYCETAPCDSFLLLMPPRNSRWKQLNAARAVKSHKRHKCSNDDAINDSASDDEIVDLFSENDEQESHLDNIHESFLKWKDEAGKHLRGAYTGSSRTTEWRKRKANDARAQSMANVPKITHYFQAATEIRTDEIEIQSSDSESECGRISIDQALEKLNSITNISHGLSHQKRLQDISKFDFLRFLSIERYLQFLKEGKGKIKSSIEVASFHFNHRNANSQGRRIRSWADHYLNHQCLPDHRQGCHVKTRSLIHDEDVRAACFSWVRLQNPDLICGASFANWVNAQLHIKIGSSNPIKICDRTAVRWMHELNLRYCEVQARCLQ